MPSRAKKAVRKSSAADQNIASKAKQAKGNIKQQRIAATGKASRVRGHVSARGKRAQAKRDTR
jgi:hypothetical protein